jgi:hypothetical protein
MSEARIFQPYGKTTAYQHLFPRPGYFNPMAKQQLISICFLSPGYFNPLAIQQLINKPLAELSQYPWGKC